MNYRQSVWVDDRLTEKIKKIAKKKGISANAAYVLAFQQFVNKETLPKEMGK